MPETRKHSYLVKETVSVTHGAISFNGVAQSAGRQNVVVQTDETIATEDHTITITNS